MTVDLAKAYGIKAGDVIRNAAPAALYEHGILYDGARVSSAGALISMSGAKTGRSPKDKRIVDESSTSGDIWWGPINMKLKPDSFGQLREHAIGFLNEAERIYIVDGFAGWDPEHQLKVRIITTRPYHALFMHNMLIRPTADVG